MSATSRAVPPQTLNALQRELAPVIDDLPRLAGQLDGFLSQASRACAGLDAIAANLAGDAAIRGWILRQANSGFYKLQRPVPDLGEACVVLGLETVSRLAFAACSQGLLRHDPTPYRGTPRGSWLHGLATGCAAAHLATLLGASSPLAPEAARVSGLLHDVGKRLIAGRWPTGAEAPGGTDHERRVVGFDHAMASAAVAASWRLPADVVNAVAGHHTEPFSDGAHLVAAADRLMHCWQVGTATYPRLGKEPPATVCDQLLAPLGAGSELVERWWRECRPVVQGLDEMLRWSERPQPPDLEVPKVPAAPAVASSPARRTRARRQRPGDRRRRR